MGGLRSGEEEVGSDVGSRGQWGLVRSGRGRLRWGGQ